MTFTGAISGHALHAGRFTLPAALAAMQRPDLARSPAGTVGDGR